MKLKKRDINAANGGVWIENIYGNIDLLIASADKKEYREMVRALMKPYSRGEAYKEMPDEKFEKDIENKALAKHILLGWRNLELDDGIVDYSESKAYEILCDPEYTEFRKLVKSLAEEEEVFRKQDREELTTKS